MFAHDVLTELSIFDVTLAGGWLYIHYILAIWEGPLCVTAELIEMVQYIEKVLYLAIPYLHLCLYHESQSNNWFRC